MRDYQEQVKAFQEKLRAAETPSETQSAILRAMDAKQREELQRLDRRIELDEGGRGGLLGAGKALLFCQRLCPGAGGLHESQRVGNGGQQALLV